MHDALARVTKIETFQLTLYSFGILVPLQTPQTTCSWGIFTYKWLGGAARNAGKSPVTPPSMKESQ